MNDDHSSIAEIICEALAQSPDVDPLPSPIDCTLPVEAFGVDSLELVELAVILERRFGVNLPEGELDPAQSVGDIARMVASKIDSSLGTAS